MGNRTNGLPMPPVLTSSFFFPGFGGYGCLDGYSRAFSTRRSWRTTTARAKNDKYIKPAKLPKYDQLAEPVAEHQQADYKAREDACQDACKATPGNGVMPYRPCGSTSSVALFASPSFASGPAPGAPASSSIETQRQQWHYLRLVQFAPPPAGGTCTSFPTP